MILIKTGADFAEKKTPKLDPNWFQPISDPWTRVAYATTQTISDSLYDQNRAVLAALGFVAAVATGGLAVQIIKKVS